jgi:hypothetical protein
MESFDPTLLPHFVASASILRPWTLLLLVLVEHFGRTPPTVKERCVECTARAHSIRKERGLILYSSVGARLYGHPCHVIFLLLPVVRLFPPLSPPPPLLFPLLSLLFVLSSSSSSLSSCSSFTVILTTSCLQWGSCPSCQTEQDDTSWVEFRVIPSLIRTSDRHTR